VQRRFERRHECARAGANGDAGELSLSIGTGGLMAGSRPALDRVWRMRAHRPASTPQLKDTAFVGVAQESHAMKPRCKNVRVDSIQLSDDRCQQ
jgi:hypothetical protein